jgi:asparagine synthase (glutamine-hydrolysing)
LSSELVAARSSDALAGVWDPQGLDVEDSTARVLRALECDRSDAALLVAGPTHGSACLFSGDLYNLDPLASELDTPPEAAAERILAAGFDRWGDELPRRLRGSFVALWWDPERREATICGDQAGTTVLYTAREGSALLFSAEAGTLVRMLRRRPAPDPRFFAHWLANDPRPVGVTPWQGVEQTPVGHLLRLGAGGGGVRCYWRVEYVPPPKLTRTEAAEELWAALTRSVGARIAGENSVGAILSGGVDSSSVVAAVVDVLRPENRRPRCYSAVFPGHHHHRVDESERIADTVRQLKLPSTQLHVHAGGAVAAALDFTERWELPLIGAGFLLERPLLERAAEDGIGVLLDGQGGDECFGFSPYYLADLMRHGRLLESMRLAGRYPGIVDTTWHPLKARWSVWRDYGLRGVATHRRLSARRTRDPAELVPDHMRPELASVLAETDNYWDWKRQRGVPAWWAYKSYLVTTAREQVGIGEFMRQRTQMFGIRGRPPIFDVDLIETALRIPPEIDFDARLDRPSFRQATAGRLPDSVRLATRKANLAPFYYDCLSGPDLAPIRRLLLSPDVLIGDYVRMDMVKDMVENPPANRAPNWLGWPTQIWTILSTEVWLRQQADPGFVDRFRAEGLPGASSSVHRRVDAAVVAGS